MSEEAISYEAQMLCVTSVGLASQWLLGESIDLVLLIGGVVIFPNTPLAGSLKMSAHIDSARSPLR